jgi:hydrogenase expression/formation protein HypC
MSAPVPGVPECVGDVCITCSDQAVDVVVVELRPDGLALVDTGSTLEEVSVALVDTHVGGRILVHAKEAIAALPEDDQGGEA